jgi:hypothetical protein
MFSRGKTTVVMARHWMRSSASIGAGSGHIPKRHYCRLPDTGELKLYAAGGGARLVMAIRHLGYGHLAY